MNNDLNGTTIGKKYIEIPCTGTSRYEYKCPFCGHVNVRYEHTVKLVCDNCGRSFYGWG